MEPAEKIISSCVGRMCVCVGETSVGRMWVSERDWLREPCFNVESLKKIIGVCEGAGMIMCEKNKTLIV